jgi:hypothetical protein
VQTSSPDQLKAAAELVHQASDLLRGCSKMDIAVSDSDREEITAEILKVRLNLSIMRRDLTVIARMVNRRKLRWIQK